MAIAKTLKERKLTIYCDYCFANITLTTYFRCEDCRFDSCPECFFFQIETEEHKIDHRFRVVSNLEKTVFSEGWRLIDELLLLNGLMTYGFDNFDDVSKILAPKTEFETRQHFFELMGIEDDQHGERPSGDVVLKSNPNDSFVLSYMSKRREFDSELLNEYEANIENLDLNQDEGDTENLVYRHMLNNYKNVRKRRTIWRNFIFDRNLVDVKGFKEAARPGEFSSRYRWLLQFLSMSDYTLFISGLQREKDLKKSLSSFPALSLIDEAQIKDTSQLINKKEEELCRRLRLSQASYVKLKKMALEFFVSKRPLKDSFFELFVESDLKKAGILYKWFKDQKITIEES